MYRICRPGQWAGRLTGGCRGNPGWVNNPTVKFHLNQTSNCTIILTQPASMGELFSGVLHWGVL